ncbi:bystin-like protein (nucleomorph) [Cryptomonas paramecium]|uniref:Bystin-like protein n=1 Tax=Cryptomonas paramaecium TaxID=2898 RepID=F2HHG8_9CRYP|nr:bystin-like protein [Cryptomonas paramecium]AEA38764.1 bystin-like protein [Cryptomonas paramecium]|mmetsp:Transcript_37242/g.99123  ORF Transcript_37242/g.99123 Transcript_37242/m.99123 type:complete len:249 (+) Transcript_37242:5425-6171(+)
MNRIGLPTKDLNLKKIKIFKILERTGILLKVHRSGSVPKIIKTFFSFKNFEDLIWFTRPDRWSFQGLFAVSKLFMKNLNDIKKKRFFSLIFLPRLQEVVFKFRISASYMNLIYKLAKIENKTFVSSIILPFFKSINCSKKECVILIFFLLKIPFQVKYTEWILSEILKISQIRLKCLFLRAFLTKKYKISNKMLDTLVDFFAEKIKCKNIIFLKCYIIFLKNYSCFLCLENKKRLFNLPEKKTIYVKN